MRIRSKVALVGGIPIAIAAMIAVVAWLLLDQAETARRSAVLASAATRDLAEVALARDDYIRVQAKDRESRAGRFTIFVERARGRLEALAEPARAANRSEAVDEAKRALDAYGREMDELRAVTQRNDHLVQEMNARAAALISLTDTARARQHASNADIVTSITEGDRRLRMARDIVDLAQELRAATLESRLETVPGPAGPIATGRARTALADLTELLRNADRAEEAAELAGLAARASAEESGVPALTEWVERLIKVTSTDQRAMHEEISQLLTYSVQAAETEQATQNIAITTLKLGRRTVEALATRDVETVSAILAESGELASTVAALPISPLIQTEMIEAIDQWRQRLTTTRDGLQEQNRILARMDATARLMTSSADALNDSFARNADAIDRFVRTVLILGTVLGLLVGILTALAVARSITRPLQRLRDQMRELAANPSGGLIAESVRRDELGSMARAANFFVTELGRRERDLIAAKERADAALVELQAAQTSLIQAEKLASLGQLVAGVAHEINTPVGIALTTSTALDGEVRKLKEGADTGRLFRSDLTRAVDRLTEGSRLLFANLHRAAELVHSFKQVAADQASGERRSFEMHEWLKEVLTSLSPVLRKAGHRVVIECPEGLVLDSYPGSLAQVVTNLITNARDHAYPDGRNGTMTIRVTEPRKGWIRIDFADDGVGIEPEHVGKVFDPFYTTGRDRGRTGLGLHIVHNIVTATLQGQIQITSRPGQGARFVIDFPAETAAEPMRQSA
ncbi:HAMP domain-containing sensor histidine kinase [Prosthecomicrobium sp. N25]|uniref:HAMP domain-containing sensor histidine kinase n=1 Tax=Prosthecomicrobium sp. N25 TaxID=3129254 RepID=UPI0030784B83